VPFSGLRIRFGQHRSFGNRRRQRTRCTRRGLPAKLRNESTVDLGTDSPRGRHSRVPDPFPWSPDSGVSWDELHRTRDRRTGAGRRVDWSRCFPKGNLRLQRSPHARPTLSSQSPTDSFGTTFWHHIAPRSSLLLRPCSPSYRRSWPLLRKRR